MYIHKSTYMIYTRVIITGPAGEIAKISIVLYTCAVGGAQKCSRTSLFYFFIYYSLTRTCPRAPHRPSRHPTKFVRLDRVTISVCGSSSSAAGMVNGTYTAVAVNGMVAQRESRRVTTVTTKPRRTHAPTTFSCAARSDVRFRLPDNTTCILYLYILLLLYFSRYAFSLKSRR